MNELSDPSINELNYSYYNCNEILNDYNNNHKSNNKRSLHSCESESSQYFNGKRLCDNDHNFHHYKDDNEVDDEDEEDLTPYGRSLLEATNRLINLKMNSVEVPEWPQLIDHTIDCNNNNMNKENKNKSRPPFPPEEGLILFEYCLVSLIKSDKRCAVFVGHKCDKTDKPLIIKVGIESGFDRLKKEVKHFRALEGGKAVPNLIDFVWWKVYNDNYTTHWGLVVTQQLGPNLIQLNRCGLFDICTVLSFAAQLIDRIECIHSSGILHCGLTPHNIVVTTDPTTDPTTDATTDPIDTPLKLYLIGLSASKDYLIKRDDGSVQHIDEHNEKRKLCAKAPKGDPNYHSIGYHNGYRRSRRDDMESLGYCIVYIAKGSLPWMSDQHEKASDTKTIRLIGQRMQKTSIDELCVGLTDGLSQPLIKYFDIISHLSFKQKPDYEALRQCFRLNILSKN